MGIGMGIGMGMDLGIGKGMDLGIGISIGISTVRHGMAQYGTIWPWYGMYGVYVLVYSLYPFVLLLVYMCRNTNTKGYKLLMKFHLLKLTNTLEVARTRSMRIRAA